MPRRSASDSTKGRIETAKASENNYDVPAGLDALTKEELSFWDHYTSAKSSWKVSDLVELHALVKLKCLVKRLQDEAAKEHLYSVNGNGALSEHPIHKMVREQQKLVQAQLRVLGLNSPHNVAAKNANDGSQAKPAGRGKRKAPVVSLLG